MSGKPILETEFYTYTGPILVEGNILYLLSGILYSGIERIGVVAIDLATFSNIWDLTLLNYDILNENALTTHGDTIFVSGDGLYALDKSTGAVRWDTHNKEVGITGHPVVIDQIVYVRNRAGKLFAFDIDTGEEIGYLQLLDNGSVNNPYETGPAVFGDLLIIPFGDNRIYAYRP